MPDVLYKLSVVVTPEAEAQTADLLQETFGAAACIETDAETGVTWVSIFLDRSPAKKLRARLPPFSVRRLRPENWAQSWKRHFQPFTIGSRLLVKPTWSRRKPRRNQTVIVLDPGLSFGTGQHPTTRFCLEQLVAFRRLERTQTFMDAGTGSGILAIAAAKLGYAGVDAFDNDPEAIRVAGANATKNRVRKRIRLTCQDLAGKASAQKYDLICANLLADVLLAERRQLVNRLKPAGRIVLAGILRREFAEIRAAYEGEGLELVATRGENEWQSGAFDAAEISKK